MSMTDPIADMLTRVRNANSAGKRRSPCRQAKSLSKSHASCAKRATLLTS